jgi:hypothetical protein
MARACDPAWTNDWSAASTSHADRVQRQERQENDVLAVAVGGGRTTFQGLSGTAVCLSAAATRPG